MFGDVVVFVSVPPLMPELPNKNQPEGHTLIIPCQATGDPTPEITWLIEGSSREYDHHHERCADHDAGPRHHDDAGRGTWLVRRCTDQRHDRFQRHPSVVSRS